MRKLKLDELNRATVAEFKSLEKFPIIVVLDNVRSMHNIGSIFRLSLIHISPGGYYDDPLIIRSITVSYQKADKT